MVVYSQNNIVKHKWCSVEFPYKYLKCNYSNKLPVNTAASEYFADGTKYETAEIVYASDWFKSFEDIRDVKLFEKCIYPTYNNTVISIIWE